MSSEAVVITKQRTATRNTRAANARRVPESDRWEAERVLGVRALRGLQMAVGNALNVQVRCWRDPLRFAPRSQDEVPMEDKVARAHLRRSNCGRWSLSDEFLG